MHCQLSASRQKPWKTPILFPCLRTEQKNQRKGHKNSLAQPHLRPLSQASCLASKAVLWGAKVLVKSFITLLGMYFARLSKACKFWSVYIWFTLDSDVLFSINSPYNKGTSSCKAVYLTPLCFEVDVVWQVYISSRSKRALVVGGHVSPISKGPSCLLKSPYSESLCGTSQFKSFIKQQTWISHWNCSVPHHHPSGSSWGTRHL